MNTHARTRTLVALLLSALLLAAPMSAMAKKGEKNFKRGMTHERAQQWEQAAQEFALAVAALPSDVEYQLHYRRAVFNASQVYMQKGRTLADKGDYVGAYNAFRQAYGYDPVNELAANEMRRVLRLQRVKEGLDPEPEEPANGSGGMRVQPSSLSTGGGAAARGAAVSAPAPAVEERAQPLRQINYNGDLEDFIRKMAEELALNVVFDQQFAQTKRNIKIQLRDVTAAQALDYVFMAYGLFFQKLSRRTILVADQSKRPQYQQLVLKTFYLYNIKPTDARTLIQTALPANAGRQPQVVTNAETNSIIVRDTPENIRIIGELLKSVDKERAEVVMEVAIYEVSRTDLLQVGNQFGTAETLGNLGGLQTGSVIFDGARRIAAGAAGATLPLATGVGLIIPSSSLSLLQRKDNTRLVFSTAVHAFDDEKSEARVGARVPVQTASVYNGLTAAPTGTGATPGNTAANVFGNGYPVIQYEDTGLVLDFTPKVYPNQEVQVKMNIETKDTDGNSLTPTFTQRKITGTARIPNGRTMMLASIGQDRETNGRQGLPLLGLIPILGRLFTAPRKNNIQSDVVITLTPRILRAPEISPSDEETKPSGTMQTPTSDTLEAVIREADREDALAAARRIPKNVTAQVNVPVEQSAPAAPAPSAPVQSAPAQTAPVQTTTTAVASPNVAPQLPAAVRADEVSFVPAPKFLAESAAAAAGKGDATALVREAFAKETEPPAAGVAVVNTNAPAEKKPAAVEAGGLSVAASAAPAVAAPAEPAADAELILVPEQMELKAGERRRLMMMLKTDAPLGLVAATLRFDPRAVAVRSVSGAVLSTDKAGAPLVNHTIDQKGVLVVSVAPASGATPLAGEGLLLIIEVEGLAAGEATISLDADKVHLIATDGRTVRARPAAPARLKVVQ